MHTSPAQAPAQARARARRGGRKKVAIIMARTPKDVREQRAAVLAPLVAAMRENRMGNQYVAHRLGIPEKRFWAYKAGEVRVPEGFIEQMSLIVGLPASAITIPEPRARFIQARPRAARAPKNGASTPNAATSGGGIGNGGSGDGGGEYGRRGGKREHHHVSPIPPTETPSDAPSDESAEELSATSTTLNMI